MLINKCLNNYTSVKQLDPTQTTFKPIYNFFLQNLFERCMRLFIWNTNNIIPPKEIESILILNGICCITDKYNNKLTAFNGWYSGEPTVYYDIYKSFSVYSPIYSNILNVNECVLVHNNSINTPLYPLINEYAILLAHNELTIINTLINARNLDGVPIAKNNAQKESILAYRNSLCNGKISVVMDDAFDSIDFKGINLQSHQNIGELIECRKKLFDSFYNDIGVKTSWNKKGNMIEEEVQADEPMLLININDMLDCRKKACEEINKKYGVNFNVDLCEELKYKRKEEINNGNVSDALQN